MNKKCTVIAAFDEEHAVKLTGVSQPQLRYWSRTGFFAAEFSDGPHHSFTRAYSFSDIVSLKVLNTLRNQFDVSLQQLRDVKKKLNHLGELRWIGMKLYVLNKKVIWNEPSSKRPQEIASGQFIVHVSLDEVIAQTNKEISKLKERDEATFGKIGKSRYVNHNAAVVSGTRIRVSAVKAFAKAGYSIPRIIREYPDLTKADVEAAILYKEEKAAA